MIRGSTWLRLCGAVLCGGSAVACSAILGFEDRSLDPVLAAGGDANALGDGTAADGAESDGATGDALPATLGAPTNVLAAKVIAVAEVKTLAGSGLPDFAEGNGADAAFHYPYGVIVEPLANNIFVADASNQRIRKIDPNGGTTTLSGTGVDGWKDGAGNQAKFSQPGGLALDGSGNVIVPEYNGNRIRKVDPSGSVSTIAGTGTPGAVNGAAGSATFNHPIAAAVDAAGNVYVAENGGNKIRMITAGGTVSTLAGSGTATFADGTGSAASFSAPAGIAVKPDGSVVYVADNGNNRIRQIDAAGVVTTIAGSGLGLYADGKGAIADMKNPTGMAYQVSSGDLYFCDSGNSRLRRMTADATVSTLAGQALKGSTDGKGSLAQFNAIQGLALDKVGNLYVADSENNTVRKATITGIGYLEVTWSPPATLGDRSIESYTATAVATGLPTKTCSESVVNKCTITGLVSGISYIVTVTATTAAETGPASAASVAIPN